MSMDAKGKTVKVGDKVRGEGSITFHDGFKVDRTPAVTVREDNGVLYFGWLSAKSFPKFWIINSQPKTDNNDNGKGKSFIQ